jgi:predicted ATPase
LISSVRIINFKRFQDATFSFGQLTVLTGLNGSGKSTVVQSILLAHQASLLPGATVPLTGWPGLDLGKAADILNFAASDNMVKIQMESSGSFEWILDAGEAGDNDTPFMRAIAIPPSPPMPIGLPGSALTYLGAERVGPRTSQPTAPSNPDEAVVGEDGRYVAYALAVGSRREVDLGRRFRGEENNTTLGQQVETWLSSLIGETQLRAALVPRTSIATLEVRNPKSSGEWLLPTNTGFGISYCLPVIVAGLLVPRNGLLIVDSPEAHLHPAAQSAMGEFLATIAASGVQVIVETHSDHVLNGVRKAVNATGRIDHSLVKIVFFGEDLDPMQLTMDDRGGIERWPRGFFDQYELDLSDIIRSAPRVET